MHTHPLSGVLQKRTPSSSLKSHTVDYLRHQTRSFEYTHGVLTQLFSEIKEELTSLGGNKALEGILAALGVPEDGIGSPKVERRLMEGEMVISFAGE